MNKAVCFVLAFLFVVVTLPAKEQPPLVIVWPSAEHPVVRFTFGKFKEMGSSGKQHSYAVDVTAENLWNKKITSAGFSLYLFDKDKVRIGDGYISISDVAPGQVVKFQMFAQASGTPVSTELAPRDLPKELQPNMPPKKVSMTVNSIPQGARVKLDEEDVGTTPKIVQVAPGKHTLEFSKDGYNTVHFPLEITPDDVSGGSVSFELGTSTHDTVELRDGSVLSGDVESVTADEVLIRIGGSVQRFKRNQVKRIGFVQREAP